MEKQKIWLPTSFFSEISRLLMKNKSLRVYLQWFPNDLPWHPRMPPKDFCWKRVPTIPKRLGLFCWETLKILKWKFHPKFCSQRQWHWMEIQPSVSHLLKVWVHSPSLLLGYFYLKLLQSILSTYCALTLNQIILWQWTCMMMPYLEWDHHLIQQIPTHHQENMSAQNMTT